LFEAADRLWASLASSSSGTAAEAAAAGVPEPPRLFHFPSPRQTRWVNENSDEEEGRARECEYFLNINF
jgi:hypothetical protein